MSELGLFDTVVDAAARERAVLRFRELGIRLPKFSELADPESISDKVVSGVGADDPHPANLFRVHWFNDASRTGRVEVPGHLEIAPQLSGVEARILVALGNRFPMVRAHKVLAAYACLAPRVVAGAFDPTRDRAIWPSTGNYARGGVAISRIMDTRGVAVLPEGMSRERFQWLDAWIDSPEDVIRTFGTESNVKEIYDACYELAKDPTNVVINQFSEFGNHLAHYRITGPAMERIFQASGGTRLAAFVAASGSAGTLGAGDFLKERYESRIVPVEALECPTMLYNGYGEHNIQGIGDKHIPLIHNAMNSDDAVAITDRATDSLLLLFNTTSGKEVLAKAGVEPELVESLRHLGLSSIANVLASIKVARQHNLTGSDVIITVATDGSEMYGSELERITVRDHPHGFDTTKAKDVFSTYIEEGQTGELIELGEAGRRRIFNLGYYTWVEQQGVAFASFERRRNHEFWVGLRRYLDVWDEMITDFNEQTGAGN
ncbi:MAG TPA: pyridoxal-phosphate dependent enzyme [Acidimicrobiia bacterium]|nr:pyridoxal-phosphate dependent enzyme [Acidimicrobiia bacterium]